MEKLPTGQIQGKARSRLRPFVQYMRGFTCIVNVFQEDL